jgi:hypothetical protein
MGTTDSSAATATDTNDTPTAAPVTTSSSVLANTLGTNDLTTMLSAFDEIQMQRTPEVLKKLVANPTFTIQQQYAQCVLELSIIYDNLRLAKLLVQRKQAEMDALDQKTPLGAIDYQVKEIEQEQANRAMLGLSREFDTLYALWGSFPDKYTRNDIDTSEENKAG